MWIITNLYSDSLGIKDTSVFYCWCNKLPQSSGWNNTNVLPYNSLVQRPNMGLKVKAWATVKVSIELPFYLEAQGEKSFSSVVAPRSICSCEASAEDTSQLFQTTHLLWLMVTSFIFKATNIGSIPFLFTSPHLPYYLSSFEWFMWLNYV